MTCTQAISSGENNSSLASLAIAVLLRGHVLLAPRATRHRREKPSSFRHDAQQGSILTRLPQDFRKNLLKQSALSKTAPPVGQLPSTLRLTVPFSAHALHGPGNRNPGGSALGSGTLGVSPLRGGWPPVAPPLHGPGNPGVNPGTPRTPRAVHLGGDLGRRAPAWSAPGSPPGVECPRACPRAQAWSAPSRTGAGVECHSRTQ